MREIKDILNQLEPEEALTLLVPEIKKILGHLDPDRRLALVTGMLDEPDRDKIASMVNL